MTRDKYGEAYQKGFIRTVRFLASRGIPGDAAQDLAQSAWTKGWEKLGQLRSESTVHTWVNTIAINAYRGSLRKEPVCRAPSRAATTEMDLAPIDVGQILGFCRPRDRALLELQIEGLTTGEIARREGITDTAMRIRLLRARRRIRSQVVGGTTHTAQPGQAGHEAAESGEA